MFDQVGLLEIQELLPLEIHLIVIAVPYNQRLVFEKLVAGVRADTGDPGTRHLLPTLNHLFVVLSNDELEVVLDRFFAVLYLDVV